MAAGLGFKDFTTGEVLTAADVDGYLMQGVLVFANATARDAAITSPQEGQTCYLKSTDEILSYSGSAWVVKSAGGGSASGLTLITRQTVTSAADTGSSFAGVFTSTYNSYLVIIETAGANSANVQMQFKYSTNTNHTGADYYGNSAYAAYNGSSYSFLTTSGLTSYNLMRGLSTDTSAAMYINGVGNSSVRATWSGNAIAGQNNEIVSFGGLLANSNTWTGLNFQQASGNITITAAVYGLAK